MENSVTVDTVRQKTENFAQAILHCSEYVEFMSAHQKFISNIEAQGLLSAFRSKKNDLHNGATTQLLMDELKELQEKIHTNQTIQRYTVAQNELVELLQRTNTVISGNIGIQFAYTEKGGCSCG